MEGRNMFIMKMQGEFFDQVKAGKKIYEIRLIKYCTVQKYTRIIFRATMNKKGRQKHKNNF